MIKRCLCLSWFNQVTPLLCCQMPIFKNPKKDLTFAMLSDANCRNIFKNSPKRVLVRVYLCHAARCPKRRPVGSDPLGANPPPFIKEWWQSWKTCYRQTYYSNTILRLGDSWYLKKKTNSTKSYLRLISVL